MHARQHIILESIHPHTSGAVPVDKFSTSGYLRKQFSDQARSNTGGTAVTHPSGAIIHVLTSLFRLATGLVSPSSARVEARHQRICIKLCQWEVEHEMSINIKVTQFSNWNSGGGKSHSPVG
jgi:hypothetical protein